MAAGRKEVRDPEQNVVCSPVAPSGSFHHDEHELDKRVSLGLERVRPRSDSSPDSDRQFRPPHFKPIPKAPKCASPSCGKKLSKRLDQCRNCSMCGEVFCYQCTNYQRRLSLSACPDDLFGTLQNVCSKCFERRDPSGFHRDRTSEFKYLRTKMIAAHTVEAEKILCCSKFTVAKHSAILKVVDRLIQGFMANPGFLSNLKSEFIVPDWQKPPHWVDHRSVNHCYNSCCKTKFKKWSTKINCRIGGQVFCRKCCKHEIMIYLEDKNGLPQWRVNGIAGWIKKPVRFELYPICSSCASNLKTIHDEKPGSLSKKGIFMGDILVVQEYLSDLQRKIDKWLPRYQQAVHALVHQASSIEKVVKLHLDIGCILPLVECATDIVLLSLRPQSPTQERLQMRIHESKYQRYKEQRNQYRYTQKQLVQHLSALDHAAPSNLNSTQKALSQQSMKSVYIEISQLVNDLSRNHSDLDSIVLESMMTIIQSIKDELSLFLDGESWEEHLEMAREFQVINVIEYLKGDQNATVRFSSIFQQCSIILHGCYCQLQTDTLDQEFPQTKRLLKETVIKLESSVYSVNS